MLNALLVVTVVAISFGAIGCGKDQTPSTSSNSSITSAATAPLQACTDFAEGDGSATEGSTCKTTKNKVMTKASKEEFNSPWKDATGLIWNNESSKGSYADAEKYCKELNARLPSKTELMRFIDQRQYEILQNIYSSVYWFSSNTDSERTDALIIMISPEPDSKVGSSYETYPDVEKKNANGSFVCVSK